VATRPSVVARGVLLAALLAAPGIAAAPSPLFERTRLDNGLTLVVQSDARVPLVGVHLSIGVGTADERPNNHGISHLVEHLVVSGPAGGPWVVAQVEQVGGHLNAGTLPDFTRFYLEVPAEHLKAVLTALAAAVQHSATSAADVERERRVVLDEIARRRADPAEEVQRAIADTTDPGHPYHLTPEGAPTVVLGLTGDEALAWHARWYRPANASLVLVGDVRPEAARAMVAEAFNGWHGDAPERVGETTPQWDGWTEARIPREGPLASVALAYPAPSVAESRESALMDCIVAILGRGASSRLATRLQAERNVATAVSVGYPTQRQTGRLTLTADCAPDRIAEVRAVLLEEVERLRAFPVSDEGLAAARARLRLEWLRANQTVEQRAAMLGFYEGVGVGAGRAAEYLAALDAVTPTALQDFARRRLGNERGALVVMAPAGALATLSASPVAAAPGPWDRPVARVESVTSWGTAPASAAIVQKVLPTGLSILVAPTPGARLACAEVLIAWPMSEQRTDPAARLLLFHALARGTTRYHGADLAAALDALGADLEWRVADDFLEIAVTAPPETLPLATTFLADLVMHPAFDADEVDHVRAWLRAVAAQVSHDPYARAFDAVQAALSPGVSVSTWPAPDAFDGIDRDELVRLHHRLLRPARLIVVVTGDVAPGPVVRALTHEFEGPQTEAPWVPQFRRPLEGAVELMRSTVRLDWPRAALLAGWNGPAVDAPDFRGFEVLATALGGGLNSRWFHAVRQAGGLAYDVSSQVIPVGGGSRLLVYLTTDAARLDSAETAVLDEVRGLAGSPLSAVEIERAKRLLVTQRLDILQSPPVYAALVAQGAFYGELPGGAAQYRMQLGAVTAETVKPLLARFLSRVAVCEVLPSAQDNTPPRSGGN